MNQNLELTTTSQRTPRKKIPGILIEQPAEQRLFLLVTGTARSVWSMQIIITEQMVEMVPVFDDQSAAELFVEQFQEQGIQVAKSTLDWLVDYAGQREVRIMFNPAIRMVGDLPLLREGETWALSITDFRDLLLKSN